MNKSDDLIDRQAAIDALNDDAELLRRVLDDTDIVGAERAKYEWGLGLIESHISDIKDLPAAQPERKTGHWNKISPAGIYECSKCGKNVMTSDISVYDFCHGCGADMREGDQNETN